jgi:hypothetical protein
MEPDKIKQLPKEKKTIVMSGLYNAILAGEDLENKNMLFDIELFSRKFELDTFDLDNDLQSIDQLKQSLPILNSEEFMLLIALCHWVIRNATSEQKNLIENYFLFNGHSEKQASLVMSLFFR